MRTEILYLQDIISACDAVEEFIGGLSKDAFLENDLVVSAVTRKLEIIGEARARLSTDIRAAHPEIDWKAMIGFRNILVHQYFSSNLDIVWEVASERRAGLKINVESILRKVRAGTK